MWVSVSTSGIVTVKISSSNCPSTPTLIAKLLSPVLNTSTVTNGGSFLGILTEKESSSNSPLTPTLIVKLLSPVLIDSSLTSTLSK